MNESSGGVGVPKQVPALKALQDMLHNRITQKKVEMHKIQNRAYITNRVWTEIETLQWVLLQILNLKRII